MLVRVTESTSKLRSQNLFRIFSSFHGMCCLNKLCFIFSYVENPNIPNRFLFLIFQHTTS